jgi:hypothetical protein
MMAPGCKETALIPGVWSAEGKDALACSKALVYCRRSLQTTPEQPV